MKNTIWRIGFCCALTLLGTAGARADTILNFDNVANATNIDSAYAGVTFSCFSTVNACNGTSNTGDVFARSFSAAPSPPNIIATFANGVPGTQDSTTGAIEVHFATAQSAVSIDDYLFQAPEGLGTAGYGYLEAFDSSKNFLGLVQDLYGGNAANLDVTKTLTFSSAAGNISYLLLGDIQGANIISAFDNLCYSSSAGGCVSGGSGNNGGGGSVPESGPTAAMLASCAAALVLKLRKKLPAGAR